MHVYTGYASVDMDISMDIHEKSVNMDMDVIFHIHGNPGYAQRRVAINR